MLGRTEPAISLYLCDKKHEMCSRDKQNKSKIKASRVEWRDATKASEDSTLEVPNVCCFNAFLYCGFEVHDERETTVKHQS